MTEDRLKQIEERLTYIEQRLKTLEIDIEPEGIISEGFERLSDDIDSFQDEARKRFNKLEHGQNQLKASLDIILRHITGMGQS